MDQPLAGFLPLNWDQLEESVRQHWLGAIRQVTPPPLLIDLTAGNLNIDEFDPKELGHKVSQDAVLAGVVLAAANSAKYGLTTPITSVQRAIVHLGFVMVKAAIASYQMEATFGSFRGLPRAHLHFARTWSAGASVIAHHWAQAAELPDPSRISTLALLSLLGCLVFGMEDPRPGPEYSAFADEPSRCAFEQQNWGVCGLVLSGQLARHWGLPGVVCEGLDRLIWGFFPSGGELPDKGHSIAAGAVALMARYLQHHELDPLEVFAEPGFSGVRQSLDRHSLLPALNQVWHVARTQRELSVVAE